MASAPQNPYTRRFEIWSKIAGAITMLLGALVLIGWATDNVPLMRLLPGMIIMKGNAAAAFVLAGLALWLLHEKPDRRWLAILRLVCSSLVLLTGVLTLSQDLFGWNLGIDQLLFKKVLEYGGGHSGRMASGSAGTFALLGDVAVAARQLALDRAGADPHRAAACVCLDTDHRLHLWRAIALSLRLGLSRSAAFFDHLPHPGHWHQFRQAGRRRDGRPSQPGSSRLPGAQSPPGGDPVADPDGLAEPSDGSFRSLRGSRCGGSCGRHQRHRSYRECLPGASLPSSESTSPACGATRRSTV